MLFTRFYAAIVLLAALIGSASAHAAPMPAPIARMISEAAKSGTDGTLETVVGVAKASYPESAPEIDKLVAGLKADAETKRVAALRRLRYYQGWSGEGEIGASRTSGNTNDTTLAVGLHVKKEGLFWRHKFDGTAEYQRSQGVSGTEKYLAGYETNYKISPALFSFGLVQWEKDRFAGFHSRLTESVGLGYSILRGPDLKWDVTAGPAFRQIDLVTGLTQSTTELRLASRFAWQISPRTALNEDVDIYVGGGNNTFQSNTALTTTIIGQLAARASFKIKKETAPQAGFTATDTSSRVTLVYGF